MAYQAAISLDRLPYPWYYRALWAEFIQPLPADAVCLVTVQMTEMHTRLYAAEMEAAEQRSLAAKATERADAQEAAASGLQRTIRELRLEAADRAEALQRELATTAKLVHAAHPAWLPAIYELPETFGGVQLGTFPVQYI